jgi:hypothetical protein
MANGTITTALIFVWMLNILMIFSQLAIDDMSNNSGMKYINCSGTIIHSYSTADCSSVSGPFAKNLSSELPGGAVPNSGFFMVDWITSATSWIGKQIDTFTQVLNTPYNMLMSIPIFQTAQFAPFAVIIGSMWWAISFFLIIAWIFGR